MNKQNIKLFLFFIIGLLTAFLAMYLINNYRIEKKNKEVINSEVSINENNNENFKENKTSKESDFSGNIDELTNEDTVINYVKSNHRLPDYYITKGEARKQGWVASKGNLCDVLPGRAIGGDNFSNREKTLPAGNKYFEADVNYNCGNRNADRIVFTKNGEVWLTKNHYKSFEKQ
ncbi:MULTISPECIES: ribonuclease domain-containing protein [unclassified Kaistella]|uniref:ribonuclease domain-containing protein n=1 Tax=unclassified Kaistella TaxID=2762626 RepID=UPI0027322C41|nr:MULTISPECIES: ribonuclease domain-containing protein [unclassified Kaistella]MDP2453443.1 ribonuclease domain-containing protein [Kaistella sp. SH11-4b]MDP2456500.1 ribonuclease domain-containing protein [Kaistella sp. SH40-3]MDP2459256.1 ribonuclease domain-containing protein [Kaistella sp. SH19-2b]